MLQFNKPIGLDLKYKYQNPQNKTLTASVEDGQLITIYTKDIISQGEGLTIEWLIPFEMWFGDIADRKTAQKVVLNETPFSTEIFKFRLFDDEGQPNYPFTKSELPYILGMVEDANLIVKSFLEVTIPELSGLINVVGI